MSETPKDQSWWHTLPGVLTALAAAVTAITGLVAVITQSRSGSAEGAKVAAAKPAGNDSKPAESGSIRTNANATTASSSTTGNSAQGATRPHDNSKPGTATTPPPDPSPLKPMQVELPDGKEAAMAAFGDKFKYSVLAATAQPLPPDKTQVTLKVRAYTTAAGGLNFWSDSFRIALGDQRELRLVIR